MAQTSPICTKRSVYLNTSSTHHTNASSDAKIYPWKRGTLNVYENTVTLDTGQVVDWIPSEDIVDANEKDSSKWVHLDNINALTHTNEPSIVAYLKARFLRDQLYCYTGRVLIAVNPFKPLPYLYELQYFQENHIPHVFAIAESAFQCIQRGPSHSNASSQTIVVTY